MTGVRKYRIILRKFCVTINPLSGYFPYLLTLPQQNKINDLRPGLAHYDNLINAEMISALNIH